MATGLQRATPTSPRRDRVVLVLDSVLVTASLLALIWSTALGGVRAGTAAPLAFAAALISPVGELVLAAMVGLLVITRPASRPLRRPLLLIGAAMLAFCVSDGLRATGLAADGVLASFPATLTPFEAYLGWLGLGLVVARQMLTIVDGTVLLARVSEGQQRLQHQAFTTR